MGALLKSKIRWRDSLARLGGDEFGVLLESCSLEDALRTAETLREAVRNYRFAWEDRTFRLGASVGVVPITADSEDVASVLSAADSACAAAKESGRNRVHCFEENDLDLMRRRREMQWAARINNALEESRFELFRMAIQPLQLDEPGAHYEILLRMRDEAGKIVSPDQFIVAAERYGITPSIDRWVIENCFRWLVSEADERERLALCSINLSGQSLGDDKFLPFVIDQFHRSGLDGRKICFEITETAAVANFSQANRFIQALKELGVRFALDEGRFELYRMPIMPLQAKEEGEHYEILVRMRDEAGKIISPDHFIAAAERYNITPAIDRWVLENTLRWLVSEADERERLLMCAINLSGQSLGDDKFLPFVIEQFQKSGLDATKICFEITETAAVASFSQANRFIKSLKELGCKFSLDDFGTGLSSFGYLKHFPVDYLKIDGSFVRGILTDPIDREMVRSINEIGHLTGKLVIAEFAENQEIIDTLASLGVDYAQGYGIAQPSRLSKTPAPG